MGTVCTFTGLVAGVLLAVEAGVLGRTGIGDANGGFTITGTTGRGTIDEVEVDEEEEEEECDVAEECLEVEVAPRCGMEDDERLEFVDDVDNWSCTNTI